MALPVLSMAGVTGLCLRVLWLWEVWAICSEEGFWKSLPKVLKTWFFGNKDDAPHFTLALSGSLRKGERKGKVGEEWKSGGG